MKQDGINLKTETEVKKMMRAGNIVAKCHTSLKSYLKPGLTLIEIDNYVNDIIEANGAKSIIKDYDGFPKYNCVSVNDCVVHGIPDHSKLKDGDIVGVDISVILDGYVADSCWTYGVGNITEKDEQLLEHTEKALFKGLNQIKPGQTIGDISFAIEKHAKRHGLGVVKELAGHGLGTTLHEDPFVPNYGKKNRGEIIEKGLTIAVEPMLNNGSEKIYMADDNWAIMTIDGENSAHFEHTIVVTNDGYEIITRERTEAEINEFKL